MSDFFKALEKAIYPRTKDEAYIDALVEQWQICRALENVKDDDLVEALMKDLDKLGENKRASNIMTNFLHDGKLSKEDRKYLEKVFKFAASVEGIEE